MLRRTTTKCSLIYGVKQDCLMGNTFNASLSTGRRSKVSRYDWVMMKFESEESNGEEAIIYLGKVLAL
jgi:hypothetical protein